MAVGCVMELAFKGLFISPFIFSIFNVCSTNSFLLAIFLFWSWMTWSY
jgi:hypothetical protein